MKIFPALSTEMMTFSGFVTRSWFFSCGRSTLIDVVTTGIVIRKMMRSTSITSTSGVVLMVETTWSSWSGEAGPTLIAMPAPSARLVGEEHRVDIAAERSDAFQRRLVAADEPVVSEHCGHRDRKADGRHDERFADGSRVLVDRRLARHADLHQRVVDAPDRAEESHERRRRSDGGEECEAVLQSARHVIGRALDRHRDPAVEVDLAEETVVLLGGL